MRGFKHSGRLLAWRVYENSGSDLRKPAKVHVFTPRLLQNFDIPAIMQAFETVFEFRGELAGKACTFAGFSSFWVISLKKPALSQAFKGDERQRASYMSKR